MHIVFRFDYIRYKYVRPEGEKTIFMYFVEFKIFGLCYIISLYIYVYTFIVNSVQYGSEHS